jgi:hypothetical protein
MYLLTCTVIYNTLYLLTCTVIYNTLYLFTEHGHLQYSVPVDCTVIYNTLYLLTVQSSTILCTC